MQPPFMGPEARGDFRFQAEYAPAGGLLRGVSVRNSGVVQSLALPSGSGARTASASLLHAHCEESAARADSMATVQVHVEDLDSTQQPAIVGNPDQRMFLDLSWQRGRAGGSAVVGLTRGTVFSISAADVVQIFARMTGTVAGRSKRIEASVSFGGSGAPLPARLASDAIALSGAAPSSKIQIPLWARDLIVMTTVPASIGVLSVSYFRDSAAGAPAQWTTNNPNQNGTPIEDGAEFVSFNSSVAMTITPIWELWL